MHFMPDTEDEDSAAEVFWPEGYKQVIRENVRRAVLVQFTTKKRFRRVYRNGYSERYPSYEDFLEKVADMVAIGAENGADDAFDEIMDSLLEEEALPALRRYTSYSWPDALPRDTLIFGLRRQASGAVGPTGDTYPGDIYVTSLMLHGYFWK